MYAPIVIPTLNRYLHLKKCIESLANNKLASETDLYISVDYPPSDKYIEGYEKVCRYIDGGITGFHRVKIFKQKSNLGPGNNTRFLFDEVKKVSDCCICTEDDNVFSPNFLEYMNWAISSFADNDIVQGVSGYSHMVDWCNQQLPFQMVRNEYNAWGSGIWFKKREKINDYIQGGILESKLKQPKNIIKIIKNRPDLMMDLIRINNRVDSACINNGKIRVIDATITFYMILENKIEIMPTITKVNNNGYDGSGVNCDEIEFKQMALDTDEIWKCDCYGDEYENSDLIKHNSNTLKQYFFGQKIKRIINKISVF